MKILAIDTSGQHSTAAIVSQYITIGEIFLNARTESLSGTTWTHSEILMPGIDRLLALTGLMPQDINYTAYTNGPGSFTGLRIGASAALGMAKALNIQAVPVPTLDALAYNVLGVGGGGLVVPMLDARRGQVYTAVYTRSLDGSISKASEYMAVSIGEMTDYLLSEHIVSKRRLGENILFLGGGADANSEAIRSTFPYSQLAPSNNNSLRAASVGLYAAEKINFGYEFSNQADIIYVRAPQAVRQQGRQQ
ncbi:MAG: tRNA (adenosine(37)-N6)-threonylcarbamoyltransferase complex dimerization subunit type 1 TsaB [Defluviitaleaceae bacterium]|nr:tRNA (adenosine(37)-N6)-threonylcarbamoyltransferase complex dimerization subunit type 1 TsaB [Defluviitaleaceae bacterium]